MSRRLNQKWVQTELIPFLDLVYDVVTGHETKKHEQWESEIARAETRINTIRNYDDSIITIDRIRLMLTSSPHLDAEDRAQASQIVGDQELVLTMLVRHAITHGPYPLLSLGVGKNVDALRERELAFQKHRKLPDIIKAPRNGRGGTANYARKNEGSYSWNQARMFKGFGMNQDQVFPPQHANTRATAYGQPSIYAGFSDPPGSMDSSFGSHMYQGMETPMNYAPGAVGSVLPPVSNAPAFSPTYSTAPLAGYNNGALTMGPMVPVNGAAGESSHAARQSRLHLDAPEFVPGAQVHYTLHAPEFVPGAREHATLSMSGSLLDI